MSIPTRPLWTRLARLGAGTIVMGVGIGLLVQSRLGMVPLDVVHVAVASAAGWTLGGGIVATQSLLLLTFWPLKIRPGLGTVLGFVIPALTADTELSLLSPPESIVARVATFSVGALLFCCGAANYLLASLGRMPRDEIMLVLAGDRRATGARRTRLSLVRIGQDVAFVVLGTVILGPTAAIRTGVLSVGTLALAVGCGPLIAAALQFFSRALREKPLKANIKEVSTRDISNP